MPDLWQLLSDSEKKSVMIRIKSRIRLARAAHIARFDDEEWDSMTTDERVCFYSEVHRENNFFELLVIRALPGIRSESSVKSSSPPLKLEDDEQTSRPHITSPSIDKTNFSSTTINASHRSIPVI